MDIIPEERSQYNITKMCRACLLESEDQMQEIFPSFYQERHEIPIFHILQQISGSIQITPHDGLPNKICRNCSEKAHFSYSFKTLMEKSDAALRSVLFKDVPYIKKEALIDENNPVNVYPTTGIKSEITFVDADPFIYDNEDYPAPIQYAQNSYSNDEDGESESEEEEEYKPPHDVKVTPSARETRETKPQLLINSAESLRNAKDDEGKLVCHICNKKLADKKGLALHIRLHTGENLKRCKVCDRGFIKNDHLKRHMLTHEKSIACEHCDEMLINQTDYKKHLKDEHDIKISRLKMVLDASLTVVCKICDMRFKRISGLRVHLNQHLMSSTFDDADIRSKIFLFSPGEVNLEKSTVEELHQYLKNKMMQNEYDKFYQIVTPDGYEMLLSDSETEDERSPDDAKPPLGPDGSTKKAYTCSLCPKTFPRSRDSQTHIVTDHYQDLPNFADKCVTCKKSFPNTYTLHKHLKSQCRNSTKKLCCIVCNKKFMWQDSLTKHRQHEHPGTEKNYGCELCGKTFSRSDHLTRHQHSHKPSEEVECPICQKKFARQDYLQSHLRAHNRVVENRYLCVFCGRGFRENWSFMVHMRSHTGEKPFQCDRCEKKYSQKIHLKKHIEVVHMGRRDFVCSVCGATFGTNNVLRGHLLTHQGIKPERCDVCGFHFYTKSKLKRHMRKHTGEKCFECSICQKRFSYSYNVIAHVRNVHEKVPKANPNLNFPRYSET